MNKPDYRALIQQLLSDDEAERNNATKRLYLLDEDAVDGLSDEFYAGVTDDEGVVIMCVIAAIGGYMAINLLQNTFNFETARSRLRHAAAEGLRRNQHLLSPDESQKLDAYFQDNASQ